MTQISDATDLNVLMNRGRLGDHRQEDDSDSVWEEAGRCMFTLACSTTGSLLVPFEFAETPKISHFPLFHPLKVNQCSSYTLAA